MFKNILIATCLLVTSIASQAALISHYGYERESTSNIVKGGGLEWLMWDVTKGMSISQALAAYKSDGWSLANNNKMAMLFNRFNFGKSKWSSSLGINQSNNSPWGAQEHKGFLDLFGITYISDNLCNENKKRWCYASDDPYSYSVALYGTSFSVYGASVSDDATYTEINSKYQMTAGAALWEYNWSEWESANYVGVALVRQAVAEVPLPASITLLMLGLVTLCLRRRKLARS
ncbi:PEP-CTERM sorting domain-containing protein [Rheinheimera tilapiae]|uniref:PEP-CTERM sorting domain-containing protein n=1 Tax=Rheinheimera tilapiae TaxID=875043 RepID=A0ABV6B8K7_9GAMM